MPNLKKKRKAQNEDFKKKKIKVGKKKPLPDNYTNTSFATKSISLPNQSVTENKSQHATTKRNLTLIDVVSQLRHYNASVKKDALAGLQELTNTHPALVISSLSDVIYALCKLFFDEDQGVRKALINFLKDWAPTVPKADLSPFASLLIEHTCSAMTHIFEDIRIDAIQLMDIWVDLLPEVLVSKFWAKVVGNYMSMLSVQLYHQNLSDSSQLPSNANSAGSVKAAAAKSHLHLHKQKLRLLSSLSNFLQAGLANDRLDSTWYLNDFIETRQALGAFKHKLVLLTSSRNHSTVDLTKNELGLTPPHPRMLSYIPYLAGNLTTCSIFESSGPKAKIITDKAGKHNEALDLNDKAGHVLTLLDTFKPVLTGSWLETAPSVFASGNITMSPALQILNSVLRLTLVLWRAVVSNGANADIIALAEFDQIIKHFFVYFPYGSEMTGLSSPEVDIMLRDMNIAFCEMTALYLLVQPDRGEMTWKAKVTDYVLSLFERADFNREDVFTSLRPAVWSLLNYLGGDAQATSLVESLLNYYQRQRAQSALKRSVLDFFIQLYLVQSTPSYCGAFRLNHDTPQADLFKKWFETLPKTLWEIKTSQPDMSRSILGIMCEAAKRNGRDIIDEKTLNKAELILSTFFQFNHPQKGPVKGPYASMPSDIQRRALDYIFFVNSGNEKVAAAIAGVQ
ncbi:Rix1 complex component [Syncephalastrum racemosum]|uniref:Pre-rRNA-processing protein n=1 Tax=Syncephalastrum racemosum TaxID=13706 RepID=A0A1X2HVB9_SYNRA|nr:Rix1 complex component [Syncephalastrum racemosum]